MGWRREAKRCKYTRSKPILKLVKCNKSESLLTIKFRQCVDTMTTTVKYPAGLMQVELENNFVNLYNIQIVQNGLFARLQKEKRTKNSMANIVAVLRCDALLHIRHAAV